MQPTATEQLASTVAYRLSFWARLRVVAPLLSISIAIPAFAGAKEDLLAAWELNLPKSGAVHLHVIEPPTSRRFLYGYDFASGAFYKAFGSFVHGRDVDGVEYRGRPVPGGVQILAPGDAPVLEYNLEEFIPASIAQFFFRSPDKMTSVGFSDGSWHVTMRCRGGMRDERLVFPGSTPPMIDVLYRFDTRGRLTSALHYFGEGKEHTWTYSDDKLGEIGVVRTDHSGTKTVLDFRIDASTNAADFAPKSVETLSAAAGLIESTQPLWFGKRVDTATKSSNIAAATTTTPEDAAKKAAQPQTGFDLRWLLIAGGAGVVVLGLWLKRRFG